MPPQAMRARLNAGDVLLGFANVYPAAGIIETVCADFDWVWIDGQHGGWDRSCAANAVRAAEVVGTFSVVRVPGHEYGIIGPYFDFAPTGVMVPMVDTAEQAAAVVAATRFPPLGNRSFGGRRAVDRQGPAYATDPDAAPVLIAQIETPTALANVDAIAATPGVDALFFGAADFALRAGLPVGEPRPEIDDAARRIAAACASHGKAAGLVANSDAVIAKAVPMGHQLLSLATDASTLRRAAAERLAAGKAIVATTKRA